jgi:FAD binding domain/D-arabinono-1,4-lactone oxidase
MPCFSPSLIQVTSEFVKDYTETHPYAPPKGILRPGNLRELVRCVLQAEESDNTVRPQGSGYSLSRAAVADDFLLYTDDLNKWLSLPAPMPPNAANSNWFRSNAGGKLHDLQSMLRPDVTLNPDRFLVHVEAGIKIKDLLSQLDACGLALATMGAGGGQSLAGAMSTGTHGSDFKLPPLFDFVRAIHLVGSGGQEWWIEPSNSLFRPDRLSSMPGWCAETNVIRDDDWFHAPVVSVGRCGVVYSVVLEVPRQFRLRDQSQKAIPWSDVGSKLMDSATMGADGKLDLTGLFSKKSPEPDEMPLRFFQVTVDLAKGKKCWVTRRWQTERKGAHNISKAQPSTFDAILCSSPAPYAAAVAGLQVLPEVTALKAGLSMTPFVGPVWVTNIDVFFNQLVAFALDSKTVGEFLSKVAARANDLTDAEVGAAAALREIALMASEWVIDAEHDDDRWGFSHEIVDGHPDKRRGCLSAHSAEFFFDATKPLYLLFLTEVMMASVLKGVPGYASLRFTGQSKCLLAMQRFPLTVAIEIAVPRAISATGDLFEEFTDIMHAKAEQHGGIPHWGQRHKLTADRVEKLYGSSLETWRYVLGELELGKKKTFSSTFSVQRGLEVIDQNMVDRVRTERDMGLSAIL